MKVLSQIELLKVKGGIAGGGNQGGDPYVKPKAQSFTPPDPIKDPVVKTGG
jgi:hypothetical protein